MQVALATDIFAASELGALTAGTMRAPSAARLAAAAMGSAPRAPWTRPSRPSSPSTHQRECPAGRPRRPGVPRASFEEKITVPGLAYGVAFAPRPCVVDASPSKPRLPTITRNTCREAGPPPDALPGH